MEEIPVFLVYILVFVFGSVMGSFICCYIWRAHNNIKIISGRSQCVHCGRKLKWWENIPILSFFILAGNCRVCKKKIPRHYLLIEFFTGVLFVFIYWADFRYFQTDIWNLIQDLFLLSFLMIIFVGDLLYQTIWPEIVWAGTVLGFIFNFFIGGISIEKMFFGLLIGGLFFLIQYLVSRGRWVGGGDVRLGIMIGLWLGFPEVLVAIFMAYIIGAIVGVSLLIFKKKNWASSLPLGSFLAIGTLFALNHGAQVVGWFTNALK